MLPSTKKTMSRGRIVSPGRKGHHAYGAEEALLDALMANGGRLDSSAEAGIGVNEMNLLVRMSKRKTPWVVGNFRTGTHGFDLTVAGLAECLRQQAILSGPINV